MAESKKAMSPVTTVLDIEKITPYWRNPRRITEEAVNAVAESLRRYGYQQPIVVDSEHVVVVGHTRLAAMKKNGVTKVEVYVTDLPPEKAREYRLVDNKTSELTSWDFDALVMELREFEEGLLDSFFPDVDLEVGQITDAEITAEDVAKATEKVLTIDEMDAPQTTTVVCPSCFHEFQVKTDTLPGLSRSDMTALRKQA